MLLHIKYTCVFFIFLTTIEITHRLFLCGSLCPYVSIVVLKKLNKDLTVKVSDTRDYEQNYQNP